MDGSAENLSELRNGANEELYNEAPENSYEEEGNIYNAEAENAYGQEAGNPYSEGEGNLYNEQTGVLYGEKVQKMYEEDGNLYNEGPENLYGEEPNDPIDEEPGNVVGELQEDSNNEQKEQDIDPQTKSSEKRWPGWPGESVFRIIVPAYKVGSIIGRKGEYIKKLCEESKARVKILEGLPGVPERAVLVSAKDEPDSAVSPAVDALMKIHKRVVDGLDAESDNALASNVTSTKLLVPAAQAGSLIGRQGATIKSIQEASGTVVRIIENLPPIALPDDRIVEIQGDPTGVHKAVELIASHLKKFLVDRSVLPLFESHLGMHREQPNPGPQSWGHPHGPATGGPGYGGNPQFMPPRPHGNYYHAPDIPPVEKPPHYGISAYGRDAPPMGGHSASIQQPSHAGAQVTRHMQIPLSYADAVIGTAGSSISYIRRASGATVTIQETRGVPGEMTVEIIGTASQVQAAEQLIQNFMAEAAAPVQSSAAAGSIDPGYNSYSGYGSSYGNVPAGSGPPAPGSGSAYGSYSNYGY